jgi:hypothetical protein
MAYPSYIISGFSLRPASFTAPFGTQAKACGYQEKTGESLCYAYVYERYQKIAT